MLFLTRCFGVTVSDAERSPAAEKDDIEGIVEKVLMMQSQSAAQQHQPLDRGTHMKGVSARGKFEVFDITAEKLEFKENAMQSLGELHSEAGRH